MTADPILLVVLAALLVGMVALGLWASKQQRTAEDFYVGGRRFGTLTATATQIASAFGGGMLVAHVGLGYKYGFAELLYMTTIAVGVLALALLVARWLRRQTFYTTTDWMMQRYGDSKALRALSSITAMAVTMGWWVSQPIAAGKVLHALTGLPVWVGLVVAAVVVIAYTVTGGITAVAYTDLLQLGLMLFGMLVLLPLALHKAGGIGAVIDAAPAAKLTAWAPGKVVVWGWILAILPGQMVLQVYHQRIFAARTEAVARRSLLILAASCLLAGVWATLLGLALYKVNPNLADPDQAMTWCVQTMLPRAIAILVLAAIVAAIISTADSALHSTASSITRDFYQGLIKPDATDADVLRFSRRCIFVLGLVGIGVGLALPFIIKVLVLGYSLTVAGLFFPLFLGHFWRRATRPGALAGLTAGLTAVALTATVPAIKPVWLPPIGAGLAASLVIFVTVSLLTPASVSRVTKEA